MLQQYNNRFETNAQLLGQFILAHMGLFSLAPKIYKWEDRNQIANCMLLTAKENGAGGKWDTPPEEWFVDKSEEYLSLHLIPKDKSLWKLDSFDDFIKKRKALILQKFSHLIQKESNNAEQDPELERDSAALHAHQ